MTEYMIVMESARDGAWYGQPNAFPSQGDAITWAKTEPQPPRGYAWMIYRIQPVREADEVST